MGMGKYLVMFLVLERLDGRIHPMLREVTHEHVSRTYSLIRLL